MQFDFPYEAHRNAGIPVTGENWHDRTYEGEDLAGVIFHECQFANLHLQRFILDRCVFNSCRFDACSFEECRMNQIQFANCTGTGFTVAGGAFDEATVTQAKLDRLDVHSRCWQLTLAESQIGVLSFHGEGCEQDKLTLSGCRLGSLEAGDALWRDGMAVQLDLSICRFGEASFERTCFVQANAVGADLSRLSLRSCNLYQSDLSGARLRQAESSIFAECQLADADFTQAELNGALFAKAKAPRARFDGASLEGALFPEATLTGASFEGASARRSVWNGADLTDANLKHMDCTEAVFRHAKLAGASVDGACLAIADLHGVEEALTAADLTGARRTVGWRAEREREALPTRGG